MYTCLYTASHSKLIVKNNNLRKLWNIKKGRIVINHKINSIVFFTRFNKINLKGLEKVRSNVLLTNVHKTC